MAPDSQIYVSFITVLACLYARISITYMLCVAEVGVRLGAVRTSDVCVQYSIFTPLESPDTGGIKGEIT